MKTSLIFAFILMSVSASAQIPLSPFVYDWSKADQSAVDFSATLPAPAGKDGFIRVQGEHLVRPDGSRFRIWGVNLCGPACFPDKNVATLMAADLARMGVNCVRFHHMDSNWGRSAIDMKRNDTRQVDLENLDRLDFFMNELRKRGIYSNINLNVLRYYKEGDGVRDWKTLGIGKAATYFNPRLIELQQEYARQLLTHKNTYTGNEYRHEPAIATIEFVNENSLLEAWAGWRLVGRDDKAGDTWSPVPVSYAEELTDQFNTWMDKNLSPAELAEIRKESAQQRVPRLKPNEFAKASRLRYHTEARFLMEVEASYFNAMKKLIREELGGKPLLVGSADHNDSLSGYPHITGNLLLDFIDGHGYWQHPDIGKVTKCKNDPMVNDPLDSTVTQYARTPVAGRPFTISETNHPFPHEYAAEGYPILTAYAMLHDWDGIYWFEYGRGRTADAKAGISQWSWFDLSVDPMKLSNITACYAMWNRGDVSAARTLILRSYSAEQVRESLRMNQGKERPFFTSGFALSTPLIYRTRFTLDGTPASKFPEPAPLGNIVAETGQLGWYDADRKQGVVTIDTAHTAGLIGFVKGSDKSVKHLSADVQNIHCAILLTSLDGKPIDQSARLLLSTTAKTTNTGFKWADDGKTVAEWGKAPVVTEPVTGQITLRNLVAVKKVTATPLHAEGRPMDRTIVAKETAGQWQLSIGNPVTTWYVINVER